ncbi:MAG: nucleoside hydrolase [Cyclobacteriaceae bacterium]|nr:nucleoside hydrolase [Cyclobacteriaceae bacterium]
MMRLLTIVSLVCAQLNLFVTVQAQTPVIFDTDMGPDYDDVGAITLLHHAADKGHIRILATIASDAHPRVAATLSVLNTYFRRADTPIGVAATPCVTDSDVQHWTDTLVARYPHTLQSNQQAKDAVDLYRQLLSTAADHSVVVITVGFLTNLSRLLESGPDRWSALTGAELVTAKVSSLYAMAGRFPEGREYNIWRDPKAAQVVFSRWPTPVVLSGFEIGEQIKTGMPLINQVNIVNSPVKDVFRISIPKSEQDRSGRMSWDQTAVLAAIPGEQNWFTSEEGRILVLPDGSNRWDPNGHGHRRLIFLQPAPAVQQHIDQLMMHQPVDR